MIRNALPTVLSALVLTGAAHAQERGFMPRIFVPPPGSTILIEGGSYTLEGTLAIHAVDGRKQAYLENLTGNVFERQNVYYPAVMPAPGVPRIPRPPFMWNRVTSVTLTTKTAMDLLAVAKLVRSEAKVKATGTWGYFEGAGMLGVLRGLTVTSMTLRGHELPAELPSVQRLITMAKKAVKEHVLGQPDTRIQGEPTAEYAGAFQVKVVARISSGWCGTAFPSLFLYDGLTGDVTRVVEAEPATR